MERFCTNCGNPLEEGTLFCPECGQKVEVQPAVPDTNFVAAAAAAVPAAAETASSSYTFGMAQPANEMPPAYDYSTPVQPEPQPVQPEPQPVQPEPQPVQPKAEPVPPVFTHENELGTVTTAAAAGSPVVKTASYFWLMLLFAIPVLGLIVMIIMSFAAKNKNLKHWVRAILIWILIGLILGIILGLVAWILGKNAGIELNNIDFNAIFQSLFDALGI